MEREPQVRPPKLVEIVRQDFRGASEVLVSFPEQWEFIQRLHDENQTTLYVAALPLRREHLTRHHFEGLRPEINVGLVFYRLYKFFQPWPMSTVLVDWNEQFGHGRVVGSGPTRLHLQPIGQAQAWFGLNHAVLWEVYFLESRRRGNWQEILAQAWAAVEKDLQPRKIFTLPHEPTFEQGYQKFLAQQGYALDSDNPEWWSKQSRPDGMKYGHAD